MNLLLIISSLLTVAVAQKPYLSCNYWLYRGGIFGDQYVCDLTINNPNGFNNFTVIGGIHLEGFTNANIDYVTKTSGSSPNVPSIICETFTNVSRLNLYNTGLTGIDDSFFGDCTQLDELLLDFNRISTITENAFLNLRDITYLQLSYNSLTTLPENVFANQQNLMGLAMNSNPFEDIPAYVFRPLENLEFIQMGYSNLNAINNQWFAYNTRLRYMYLPGNGIVLKADTFVGLDILRGIDLSDNEINEIPVGTFSQLSSLQNLVLFSNNFSELHADSFQGLGNLTNLDISLNPINVVHDGAFRGLTNLSSLDMSSCRLRQLHSNSFEDLGNLTLLRLNYNEIEELPQGLLVSSPNLDFIGLLNNRLKTLNRNSFGTLTNLRTLDLHGNVINALDRAIIDDAVNLDTLHFNWNLCANSFFPNFQNSRPQYLAILERCFFNFRYIIETITDGGDAFSFFDGLNPGIALRVNTDSEVQIALTPFNSISTSIIEIFIGSTNNTRSGIRVNQGPSVITVSTPNIIIRDQWNDFRVTWANQVVLVYSGNDTFPFIGFTMQDLFPVNFYGLRSVNTSASWSVQPFEL